MSLVLSLSQGSLEMLLNGGSFENPVVQILEHNVTQDNDGYERFQLLVSDGMHSHNFHMLKTPENAKLMQDLSKYSVVRIQKFISLLKRTNTSEKFDKIILNMEMVMDGKNICKELGNPQIWRDKSDDISRDSCKPMVVPSSDNQLNTSIAQPGPSNVQHTELTAEPTTPAAQPNSDVTRTSINKIADLQNYNNSNSWQIKACVRYKSTIRKTKINNNWFEMKLFDDSGEIRVIAFGNVCDKFHSMFQRYQVYLISGGMLKQERRQYRTNNRWQIQLQINTEVQECMEDDFMPSTKHDNFIPIREIYSRPHNCFIDVIGVCKSATGVQDEVIKDKLVKIRHITLVDNSSNDGIYNQVFQNDYEIKKNRSTLIPTAIDVQDSGKHVNLWVSIHKLTCFPTPVPCENSHGKEYPRGWSHGQKLVVIISTSFLNTYQIRLTLWDKEAEKFDATGRIMVKGARVTQFQGMKELMYSQGRTSLHKNPVILEERLLRRFYDIANKEYCKQFEMNTARHLLQAVFIARHFKYGQQKHDFRTILQSFCQLDHNESFNYYKKLPLD